MRKRVDATQGSIVKAIFVFAIPLVITILMQHMFDIADKAVLGQMANSIAVASVGVTSAITSLILNGFVGLSTGVGIVLARFVGQKNEEKIKDTIETSLIASVVFGCVVAVIGIVMSPLFLRLVNCPAECYDGALIYLRIYLASAPIVLLYNYGSTIVRILGDTQRPLYYIIISGIINVVLNFLLCLILPQKVVAVAVATVVSKLVSAILITRRILNFDDIVKLSLKNLRFKCESLKLILKFGIPVSISNLLLPIANLQIAPQINSYGAMATAGNTAAIDLCNIPLSVTSGFSSATTTFMGQNIGAEKHDRVRKTFWYTLFFATVISGSIGAFIYFTGEFWAGIIVGRTATVEIEFATIRLFYTNLFAFIHAYGAILGAAEQAYGYPFIGTIKTIVCILVFRVFWMNVVYPVYRSFDTIMLCFTVSWILIMIFNTVAMAIISYRYKKGLYKKI